MWSGQARGSSSRGRGRGTSVPSGGRPPPFASSAEPIELCARACQLGGQLEMAERLSAAARSRRAKLLEAERAGGTLELGTLWRRAKLRREASAVWHVGSLLDAPHSAHLRQQLEAAAPSLASFLRAQPHLVQATLLRATSDGRALLCLNAHLVQNTLAANGRTLQAALALRHAEAWAAACGVPAPALVLWRAVVCSHGH